MSFPARIPVALALLAGAETAGMACVTFTEEKRIADADVVVDGMAVCDTAKGTCRLRARKVVKDGLRGTAKPAVYRVHYDPEERARLDRQSRRTGAIPMCRDPWEPESQRVEGRFYLNRSKGKLLILQDSVRGPRPAEEAAE